MRMLPVPMRQEEITRAHAVDWSSFHLQDLALRESQRKMGEERERRGEEEERVSKAESARRRRVIPALTLRAWQMGSRGPQ